MMEKSKPSLEKRTTSPMEDIRPVAIPTSSTVYSFAAIIQKKKPHTALNVLVIAMKNEFLKRGSLANLAIARLFRKRNIL
jgi:hypothetical protein